MERMIDTLISPTTGVGLSWNLFTITIFNTFSSPHIVDTTTLPAPPSLHETGVVGKAVRGNKRGLSHKRAVKGVENLDGLCSGWDDEEETGRVGEGEELPSGGGWGCVTSLPHVSNTLNSLRRLTTTKSAGSPSWSMPTGMR